MENITLYSISYYKRSVFKGSYLGMNFQLGKAGDDEHPTLKAVAWKGPFILDKTKEELFSEEFEFSDEGIQAADEWLSAQQEKICGSQL